MLQCESLRLARHLASAVLQFHETPILKESWRSEDVVFFGENTISILKPEHPDMKTPHLNVRVRTMPGRSNSTATNNSFLNTIPYTFGLGILLLELAYQTPFNDLRLLDSSNSLSLPSSPPSSLPSSLSHLLPHRLLHHLHLHKPHRRLLPRGPAIPLLEFRNGRALRAHGAEMPGVRFRSGHKGSRR